MAPEESFVVIYCKLYLEILFRGSGVTKTVSYIYI
jgi:hypothetical protein